MDAKENLGLLVEDLFREDELGAVVRAHICIESLLRRIIDLLAPAKEHVKKMRLDYDNAINLALLLGLREDYGPPLRVLGKLRNEFAHKPSTSLSKEKVYNLYRSLNPDAKQQLQDSFKSMKEEHDSVRGYKSFSDLPPRDQFNLIVAGIWAQVASGVVLLEEDKS